MFCVFSCAVVGEGVNADSLSVCLFVLPPDVTCAIAFALGSFSHSWFATGLNGKKAWK